MNRLIIAISLFAALAFIPPTVEASSSNGGSSYGSGIRGKITSVTPTNFTVTRTGGHRHRSHRYRTASTAVHYNPDTVSMTLDGVAVRFLDVRATGKYVTVVGTIHNNVLEATSIIVTTSPPAHHGKSKSASQ